MSAPAESRLRPHRRRPPKCPAFYSLGEYDLAGFIVGNRRTKKYSHWQERKAGDTLLAIPFAGLHTHGYSLARNSPSKSPLKFETDTYVSRVGNKIGANSSSRILLRAAW